jgi:hypothetical protein
VKNAASGRRASVTTARKGRRSPARVTVIGAEKSPELSGAELSSANY